MNWGIEDKILWELGVKDNIKLSTTRKIIDDSDISNIEKLITYIKNYGDKECIKEIADNQEEIIDTLKRVLVLYKM